MISLPNCSRLPTDGHGPKDGPGREHIIGAAARVPSTAETAPAKAQPMLSASAATMMGILAGMGVHFTVKLRKYPDDGARSHA
jgi:hypothetical protein